MELSINLRRPSFLPSSLSSITNSRKRSPRIIRIAFVCCVSSSSLEASVPTNVSVSVIEGRRAFMTCFLAAAAGLCACDVAGATSTSRRALKGAKVPESEYKTLPNGLKYYDLKVGNGAEAVKGSRVATTTAPPPPDHTAPMNHRPSCNRHCYTTPTPPLHHIIDRAAIATATPPLHHISDRAAIATATPPLHHSMLHRDHRIDRGEGGCDHGKG
ncbi:hypothetical protein R6Q59_007108 [Mikania micrantha]